MTRQSRSPWTRRAARAALQRTGLRTSGLGGAAWVVQRGEQPSVHHVGDPGHGGHVVLDEESVDETRFLERMGDYLGKRHVAYALRRLDANCVIDVGANRGQFGLQMRRMGYTGRIVSFEPVAAPFERLSRRASEDHDWAVHNLALGDEEGEAQINSRPGAMSSLLPTSDFGKDWHDRLNVAEVETIQIRRLDALLDEVLAGLDEPRVFLKMDTQGYDLATMRGAGERIGEMVGLMSEVACVPIYEGMARLPEQLATYESAGFEVVGFYPVSTHRRTMRAIEYDVLMVRADAVRPDFSTP